LKNKKVLFLKKKNSSRCQNQNKKALFTDSIFREGFVSTTDKIPTGKIIKINARK
jgi:hypothetical protein